MILGFVPVAGGQVTLALDTIQMALAVPFLHLEDSSETDHFCT
jgi:hypothetical protein